MLYYSQGTGNKQREENGNYEKQNVGDSQENKEERKERTVLFRDRHV
jgi:hypothetical protein